MSDTPVFSGEMVKADPDRRIIFGWAYVAKDKDGDQVYDHSGDFVTKAENLEDKAYDFVLKSRTGNDIHMKKDVATLIESVVVTKEKRQAMGIPDGILPDTAWWVGFKVHDDDTWDMVKSGERAMFSIGGRGVRKEVE